jgi:mRNA-degrading endonuclease RelE of RelBE toxin-antitoxin system
MSGRRYQIFMAPSAHKRYKKFDADLQRKVKEESEIFAEDPYDSNILKGQLKGIKRGCGTSISL